MKRVRICMLATMLLAVFLTGGMWVQADEERERDRMDRDDYYCDKHLHRHGMGMMGMGGPGMMGGMGMMHGPGMMGPVHRLDLSDDQRKKINAIHDDLRKQHWKIMGQMMDEHARLRDLYAADKLDKKAIGAVYDRIFEKKKQMIDARIEAHNRQSEVLTKEQREKLKNMRYGDRGMGMMERHRGMMQ